MAFTAQSAFPFPRSSPIASPSTPPTSAFPGAWADDPISDARLVEIAEASERGEFAIEIQEAVDRLESALPDGRRITGPPWRIVDTQP